MRSDRGSCKWIGWKLMTVVGLAAGLSLTSVAQPSDPAPSLDKPLDKPVDKPVEQPAQPQAQPAKETFSVPKASPVKDEPAAAPSANQDPAAKEAFDQFVDAMKGLKTLSFDVTFSVEGNNKEMFGSTTAKVIAKRTEHGWSYRMTGKGKRTAKADDVAFDVLYADSNASWLDKDAKKLFVRPASTARGKLLEAASNLRTLSDLFLASPLSKERSSSTLTIKDPKKAGEIDCIIAMASGAAGTPAGDAEFWFGKDDHLPRKIVRERSSTRGTTSMVLEISELKKDPTLPDSEFELALPEGYSKDEQSASKPSTPPAPAHKAASGEHDAPILPAAPSKETHIDETLSPGVEHPSKIDGERATPLSQPARPGNDGEVTKPGTTPDAKPDATSRAPSHAAETGPIQAFELKTADGKSVTLESLRGQPAVIMFLGSWSLSSKKALPDLKEFADRYKDKARVYVAAVRQRDSKAAAKMIADAGLDVPVLVSADSLAEQWHVGSYPALFVLGADGEFLKKPDGSKVSEMFAAARSALDIALGMAPLPAAKASPESEPDIVEPKDATK